MKRYFLQLLVLAFVISPMFGQNALQSNDSSEQDLNMVTNDGAYYTDEKFLMQTRSAHYNKVKTSQEANENVEADALFVYPNPSKGFVKLKLSGKITIYIYTLSSQFVQKTCMPPGEKILDLSALPPGAYHIMALSDDDYFSGKLIIQ